jgi:hypothetical protein
MMRRAISLVLALVLVPVIAGAAAAQTSPSETVTPSGPVFDGQSVTVAGDGWQPSGNVHLQQCDLRFAPSLVCTSVEDAPTDHQGHFSTQFVVHRFVQGDDCARHGVLCVILVTDDDPSHLTFRELQILPEDTGVPDVIVKRRSDGALFCDNTYYGECPFRRHAITPGGYWTFAILVQNDGLVADHIVASSFTVPAPFSVQFFWGYSDVTAEMTGSGLDLGVLDPGESRLLAVRFHAPETTVTGSPAGLQVVGRAGLDPTNAYDNVGVGVGVVASG